MLAGRQRRSQRSPDDRWDPDAFFDDDPDAPGKMYTPAAACSWIIST